MTIAHVAVVHGAERRRVSSPCRSATGITPGELGIDCRYCHTSVEKSSFAGVPPTQTCMTCHSQIWTNASMLEPVRASYRNDTSLDWTRVNALPDFVYFDHSIHVAKGIGCTTCHGPIAEMPLTVPRGHAVHVLVPRLPPPAGKICAAEIRGVQSVLRAAVGREAARIRTAAREGIQNSELADTVRRATDESETMSEDPNANRHKNSIDLAAARAKLEREGGKRFWQSLEELSDTSNSAISWRTNSPPMPTKTPGSTAATC